MEAGYAGAGLGELIAGRRWQSAALRGTGVFLLGYLVLPLLLGRGASGMPFLQFLATSVAYLLVATAVFRWLRQMPWQDALELVPDLVTEEPVPTPEVGEWTPELLRGLPQNKLEMLAAAYYREKGIRVDAAAQPAWGGLMLRLYQEDGNEAISLVRCKACEGQAIERRQIEELLRAMVEAATPKGFYFALDGFSEEAQRLARSAHITPIDARLLLAMLNRLAPEARARMWGVLGM